MSQPQYSPLKVYQKLKIYLSLYNRQNSNTFILCICLLQGLILAHTVKYNVETVLNLHTALGRPMGKACALSVCHLVESLKAIEHTYHRHGSLLADSIPHVIQYLTYQVLSIVATAKVT